MLTIDSDHLVIERAGTVVRLPIRNVTSAYVTRRLEDGALRPTIEIMTRFGTTLSARMADDEHARDLVDALGFGPGGKVVTIPLARRTRRFLHPLMGLLAYVIGAVVGFTVWWVIIEKFIKDAASNGAGFGITLTLMTVAAYFALKRLFAAPVVRVGNDGVTVKRLLSTTHVPRSELSRVSLGGADGPVVVERRDGRHLGVTGVMLDATRVHAVTEVAAERLPDAPPPDRAASFARGGRAVSEWRAGIRAVLDPGYRASGATVDDASAVLASASSTVDQRLGAAMALRVAGEPKERIRIAAEGATDPRVRVALEAIADDEDDEALEKKLRKLR